MASAKIYEEEYHKQPQVWLGFRYEKQGAWAGETTPLQYWGKLCKDCGDHICTPQMLQLTPQFFLIFM